MDFLGGKDEVQQHMIQPSRAAVQVQGHGWLPRHKSNTRRVQMDTDTGDMEANDKT